MVSKSKRENLVRFRYQIVGSVQGMGFRPFVWRLATSLKLAGSVCNNASGVVIDAQGEQSKLEQFERQLRSELPFGASIENVARESSEPVHDRTRFEIGPSQEGDEPGPPRLLPDLSVCEDCRREFENPEDRRYRYPFINCTACGPRFTIIREAPYDRERTTMNRFQMCEQCHQEYLEPQSRRFHAQPIACPDCGPRVWYCDAEKDREFVGPALSDPIGDDAIERFHREIARGQVVAVKGIGGFHLVCDPLQADAVERLRQWKQRSQKPFALMVKDLETANSLATLTPLECESLQGRDAPIVIVAKRPQSSKQRQNMLDRVAPQSNRVGLMLPYSPLHLLLLEQHSALIVTSANLSDEPIVHPNQDALALLSPIADGFLLHDRPIQTACDDSVVMRQDHQIMPVRVGRGIAPRIVPLASDGPCVLALGGDLKSAFCFAIGDRAWMSPHIGDLDAAATMVRLAREIDHFEAAFRLRPDAVAADMHPGYHSRRFAEAYASRRGIPCIEIQHHRAHVASLRAEHVQDKADGELITCCFDGTGYAPDGTIWGGEWFAHDGDGPTHVAQLAPVPLPGGDLCARKPSRSCLAFLHHCGLEWSDGLPAVTSTSQQEQRVLRRQLERELNCVSSSSAGRWFDAVSALLGLCQVNTYEGEAAVRLEQAAEGVTSPLTSTADMFTVRKVEASDANATPRWIVDLRPTLRWLVRSRLDGRVDIERCAAAFHHVIADIVVDVCLRTRDGDGQPQVGLTGGVFQNRLLTQRVRDAFAARGMNVWTHSSVPPNDGGLALGQAVIARRLLM